jgi:hypothetical protein
VLAALAAVASDACAGAAFGFRVGRSDVRGDLFRGSGSVGGVGMFGLQGILPVAGPVSLVLAGEYVSDSLHFRGAGDPGATFAGSAHWQDLAVYASLRVRLLPVALGPVGIYAGGGTGARMSQVRFGSDVPLVHVPEREGIGDFIRKAEKSRTNLSWHLLAGGSVGLPVFPLSVFAESRFEDVSGHFQPHGLSVYAGLNLELP